MQMCSTHFSLKLEFVIVFLYLLLYSAYICDKKEYHSLVTIYMNNLVRSRNHESNTQSYQQK